MDLEAEEYSRYSHYKTVEREYPYILLREPIVDATVILIDGLPEGDLPLLVDMDGVCRQVKKIKRSLLVLKDILIVRKFSLGTKTEEIPVSTMEEILESNIKWT